jgi:hypothetical protein
LTLAGLTWRVPRVKELQTIIDYSAFTSYDTAVFSAGPSNLFWSSTPYAGNSALAWTVDFILGGDTFSDSTGNINSVRCVH